jgi:phosphopantetheine--protein transferase-like protein
VIIGVGIDMVSISELTGLIERLGAPFLNRTFTKNEIDASKHTDDEVVYLSTRFAAKEAVFKAVAHFTKNKTFDLRIVETLEGSDGYPIVQITEELRVLLNEAGIESLYVSMSTESDLAIAFVVASSDN